MVNLLTNFRQSAAEGVGVKTVRLVTCGLECSVGNDLIDGRPLRLQ